MASVNKHILVGRVGEDPTRWEGEGKVNAKFSIATSESWKDRNGEKKEKTQWHSVVVWGKSADYVSQYVKKGDQLYVEGAVETRTYEKDNQTKYVTETIARKVDKLANGKNHDQ